MAQKSAIFCKVRWIFYAIFTVVIIAAATIYVTVRASLPQLDGVVSSPEIGNSVLLERDRNGLATLTAENRLDLAYATGFLHAQERFFQMDLSRRRAAGELSGLFGSVALATDRKSRIHRFRARARAAISRLTDSNRALLDKYVAGVNDGLNNLDSKPFEYWLLQQEPQAWEPEDSFLVIYSMFFALQSGTINSEQQKYYITHSLDPELAKFLLPTRTEWEAPIEADATAWQPQKIPDAAVIRLSGGKTASATGEADPVPGSNNWAVSGKLTANGSAMLANDMHLGLRAPGIWYRLRLKLGDGSLDISGVSLPGTPLIVAGSNGSVAWGYTNSYVDTSDLVELKINPENDQQYLTPDGYRNFTIYKEEIKVKDAPTDKITVQETIWGPVVDLGTDRKFALKWVAHAPEAINMGLVRMEHVRTVQDAMKAAPHIGIPTQNAMLADSQGNIGWTHFGALPRRKPGNYVRAGDWSDGQLGWDGWLDYDQRPRVYNPPDNRLWSANSRVVSGEDLKKVGDGGGDIGARQHQIRDDLRALKGGVVEKDLYAIQLDNRAIFWGRWQKQLLGVLKNTSDEKLRAFTAAVENWGGRAAVSSVGFRLVKNYRQSVSDAIFDHLTAICAEKFPRCDYTRATHRMESPLWRLVSQRPDGWLPAEFHNDWQRFFEKRAATAWTPVLNGKVALRDYIWGKQNMTAIRHPLSRFVPMMGHFTDMPDRMQDGVRHNMPHISAQGFGQSERIVVSPGHEDTGIMNMPAGQAGNPLSPYYGAGQKDWLTGHMTPFLPGKTKWTLHFVPNGSA